MFSIDELKKIGESLNQSVKNDYDEFLQLYEHMIENSMENKTLEVKNTTLKFYEQMLQKLNIIINIMPQNKNLHSKIQRIKSDVVETIKNQNILLSKK